MASDERANKARKQTRRFSAKGGGSTFRWPMRCPACRRGPGRAPFWLKPCGLWPADAGSQASKPQQGVCRMLAARMSASRRLC